MDIFKITKSEARKKILQLFFADPGKKYYLRELERILGVPVGNVRRELLALEKAGLFKKERMGNQVYYFLDKEIPIFDELKKIISKTIGLEAGFRKVLGKVPGIVEAFIYGSFAREKEDRFSDIDLMIIGKPDENVLIVGVSSLEDDLGREVNYSVFSPADLKRGLSRKEVFLEEVMAGPKIFIIGDKNVLEKIIGR